MKYLASKVIEAGMKKIVCLLIVSVWIQGLVAQTGSVLERTKLALKSGNAQQLGQMMGEKIQLGFDGEATALGAKEGERKMDGFFKTNPTSDLSQLFQGQSKDGKQYFIGVLKTKNGNFRVSVYWVESPSVKLLSIDFSKE